ncbi:MAG: penicillin acylase family protein [Verrucomicrobia bacterium]|nr:penicillin acylase family protein [Verrucomicrobiota bacterium]
MRHHSSKRLFFTNLWLALAMASCLAAPSQSAGESTLELIRDEWGIPHVFASTDEGAVYGLGYAAAEDRGFQMHYVRRLMQGRLAETVGIVSKRGRGETTLDHDRKMRAFGYYHAAEKLSRNLDTETTRLLQAYADGVNAWFKEHPRERHYLFDKLGIEPEPWTPADCIVSWWHIAQFFGTDGTRDWVASRSQTRDAGRGRDVAERLKKLAPDDSAAVVQRSDISEAWLAEIKRFLREKGLAEKPPSGAVEGPKFSHAWAVSGARSSTGSAMLVSDPRTQVANPSLFYEFHIQGKTFNARGIGVAGSPIILVGFNEKVAWGMTALGADQADLFRLKTDPAHTNQYFFDGQWRHMEVVNQSIKVKGGEPRSSSVRWTHFGPVITDFVFAQPGDGEFAVKRVPICETTRDTLQGALGMMRSRTVQDFSKALAGWRFPSANVVFADAAGSVGYSLAGAMPVHSPHAIQSGTFPHDGSESKFDWQGIVPQELLPQMINPKRGYILSANHRPIGSFYKVPVGNSTGSAGDTLRSFRLRELLESKRMFAPEDMIAIHSDTVNPARRELVRIGFHLRDRLKADLSPEAGRALAHLEPWFKAGAKSDLKIKGAELAHEMSTMFRAMSTELALQYGGGESGLCAFLKDVGKRLGNDPAAPITPLERAFVESTLRDAWNAANQKYGGDPEHWPARAQEAARNRAVAYYEGLDGFPSLDPDQDLAWPNVACLDGGTINSQSGQAYTQFVPLGTPDDARSILPQGESERPGHLHRTSTAVLWSEGKLHPAPISRKAVDRHATSRKTLSY